MEVALAESGLAFSLVRPNSFMQNYLNFCGPQIKADNAFYLPMGNGRVSLIDARDVAEVAAEILTTNGHIGKAYVLTGPEAINNQEVAAYLSENTGRTISYVDIPEQAAREAMLGMGMPAIIVEWILELYAINKAGYTAEQTSDVKEILGREPRKFKVFAADFANSF